MMAHMNILAAFLIGLASGTLGAISAGGGLITIPGLIFLGLSPVSAIATTRLSAVSLALGSLYRYHKAKAVIWWYMPIFFVAAALAGVIGSKLLLLVGQADIRPATGVLLLVMLPILFLRKDFGTLSRAKSRNSKVLGLFGLFLAMIYIAMFGPGGGIFLIYIFVYFFGMTVTSANANGVVVGGFTALVALVTYVSSGAVNWQLGIPLLLGAAIGGHVGAQMALKKGTGWVKLILAVVIIVSGLKLIFY
jgi:uncharacterized membrane protein YfcA